MKDRREKSKCPVCGGVMIIENGVKICNECRKPLEERRAEPEHGVDGF